MSTASRYTPSLHSGEQLEKLFVGRHELAARIIDRITDAATSKTRNHTLIVGPRGAGKTHLISVLYHRTRHLIEEEGLNLVTAWLDEDPWLIHSLDDLLDHIVERLEPEVDPSADAEQTIREVGAATPIVVFLENFDQILDRIAKADEQGQHRLRHLLQDSLGLVFVASSTRLSEHVRDTESPFYGFFTTDRLEPFPTDLAAEMLLRLARHAGDETMATYLEGDEAKGRLAVVEHLAGGQPRMWATLNTAIDVHRLDTLVDHLLTRFDDLTPYYQEQLARLAPQQQRVVATLAEHDRPMSTKELATDLGTEQRSLGKTMHELVDRGWIVPSTSPLTVLLDGRLTYYDLAEPLVRVAFQLKSTRRAEPLRIVVEFLKGWLSPTQFDRMNVADSVQPYLDRAASDISGVAMSEVARRLQHVPATRLARYREPVVAALWEAEQAVAALAEGDPTAMFGLPSPVRASLEVGLHDLEDPAARSKQLLELRLKLHREAREEAGFVPHPAFEVWLEAASALVLNHPESSAALANAARWAASQHDFATAESLIARLADSAGEDHLETLMSRGNLAVWYQSVGRLDEALALDERTVADRERVLGVDHPATLTSRANLAICYQSVGRLDEALALGERTLADRERVLGSDHPYTAALREWLASVS